ncbi:O-succinylbenzoic acid--CoA ligase [Dulcicalothrix desertica PCC 7102]|uniref:O-succinylbenzoic acid--CoA ligase n=1 Tax=Dulcicalothrix desertica PCC 7102 TaxID=232991 RepID=A0A433VVA5_9CYAN|nr:2-succinylbenzoate--CoA ligase [Dulcicalothrix desertica]RUT10034.1 O-succinylbenzoic acid--CoA ligase [Dulcicalothrix desertica PCC 7102]TWH40988.1 O-succinylbenzoic acid--CoA ligase [Dulcicalothrix desertica PCC 7102]
MVRLQTFDFACHDLFGSLVENFSAELAYNCSGASKVIIAERDPVKFLAGFLAAVEAKCQVFLCNPDWGDNEWRQVLNLVQPDIIWGKKLDTQHDSLITQHSAPSTQNSALIMIPTGGSAGKVKFCVHTWETLVASVRGFTEYFQVSQVNSVCLLPLYHVSGLMQFVRAFTTSGKLSICNFKQLVSEEVPDIDPSGFFISLVPTQLQRFLLDSQLTIWLSKFETVLLGGAPAWDELLEKARYHQIRLAPTYGMTETASQIVTLKPDDFLRGKRGCGKVLPHARVSICDGKVCVESESLFLGYYGDNDNSNNFQIDDIGYFDEQGYLYIVGRDSSKIITGGENVYPEEVEAAIRETQMVIDVCVVGIADKYWGQAVTAVYVPKYSNTSTFAIETILKYSLSKYKIPKYWAPVSVIPRNLQGKVNRNEILKIAVEYLGEAGKTPTLHGI